MEKFMQSMIRTSIRRLEEEIEDYKHDKVRELECLSWAKDYRKRQIATIQKHQNDSIEEKELEIAKEKYLLDKEILERNTKMETSDKLIHLAEKRIEGLQAQLRTHAK